jgi:hypothetical protein
VRRRGLRASKADLIERLLSADQAYAEIEQRWLWTVEDLLLLIMLVDKLIATPMQHLVR